MIDEDIKIELDDEITKEANAALSELGRSDTIATQALYDNYTCRWIVHLQDRLSRKRFSISIIHEESLVSGLRETIKRQLLESM